MIPDYLTFIRYQDKLNLAFIYIVTIILLLFYGNNASFTFSLHDLWIISAILALVLYNFIIDLKAYWAYKCVIKNIDFSYFKDKKNTSTEFILTQPLVAAILSLLLFFCLLYGLYLLTPSIYIPFYLLALSPLFIFILFRLVRNAYVKQVAISATKKVKFKKLSYYVIFPVCISTLINLLTISPLRFSEKFSINSEVFSIKSIVTMMILCLIVLALNLLSIQFTKRYIFLGRLFLNEIDLLFSKSAPSPWFFARPLWFRIMVIVILEALWIMLMTLILTLTGWRVWFEFYFLICYLPGLIYYFLHTWWKWHNDFMMACDMSFRWWVLNKQKSLW